MRCPKCGYNSFEHNLSCPKCRKNLIMARRNLAWNQAIPGQVNFFDEKLKHVDFSSFRSASREQTPDEPSLPPNGGPQASPPLARPPKITVSLADEKETILAGQTEAAAHRVLDLDLAVNMENSEALASLAKLEEALESPLLEAPPLPDGSREFEEDDGGDLYQVSFEELSEMDAKAEAFADEAIGTFEFEISSSPLEKAAEAIAPLEELAPLEEAAPLDELAPLEEAAPLEELAPLEEAAPLEALAPLEELASPVELTARGELELAALPEDAIFNLEDLEIKKAPASLGHESFPDSEESRLELEPADGEIDVELDEAEITPMRQELKGIYRESMDRIQDNLAKTGDLPKQPGFKPH